jgi:hypothetical protein
VLWKILLVIDPEAGVEVDSLTEMKAEDGASPLTVAAIVSLGASIEAWGIKGSMESVESATREYRGLCAAMHLSCFGLSTKGALHKTQL